MKHLQFSKGGETHSPIKHWKTDNVTEVAIYQGSRGENPDIDFIVKYKEEGKRLRTPSHTHWIVDLLVKSEVSKDNLLSFVNDMIKIYDEAVPFKSVEERNKYVLKYPALCVRNNPQVRSCSVGYLPWLKSIVRVRKIFIKSWAIPKEFSIFVRQIK
jgi:hypothetical protein